MSKHLTLMMITLLLLIPMSAFAAPIAQTDNQSESPVDNNTVPSESPEPIVVTLPPGNIRQEPGVQAAIVTDFQRTGTHRGIEIEFNGDAYQGVSIWYLVEDGAGNRGYMWSGLFPATDALASFQSQWAMFLNPDPSDAGDLPPDNASGRSPQTAEVINESTIPPASISSTRDYNPRLGGYSEMREIDGVLTDIVYRPMVGDTQVYSERHLDVGPNGMTVSIERPVVQYQARPTGVREIEFLPEGTPQMENFEQGMRQIYLDFYRKMYPGVDPEQALLEDRVITFSWLENPIAVDNIRIAVRQGISTQAELDAIIRSNLVEYSFRPSQGISFFVLYPMGAQFTYPGVVPLGHSAQPDYWIVPKGFVATPEGRLGIATEYFYDFFDNSRSRGSIEDISAHVGFNAGAHMAFRLAMIHYLIGPNPDFEFVLQQGDPLGAQADSKTSEYGVYLGLGNLNLRDEPIDTEMYPKDERGVVIIPLPRVQELSFIRGYWND